MRPDGNIHWATDKVMTFEDTRKLLTLYNTTKNLKRRALVVNSGGHGKKDGTYPGTHPKQYSKASATNF